MTRKTFKAAWSKCANDQLKDSIKKEEDNTLSSEANERLLKIETMLTMMNNSFFHLSNQLSEIKHLIKCNSDK